MVGCAFALVVLTPTTANVADRYRSLVIGAVSGVWALALTTLFVRWEAMGLSDVGAGLSLRSMPRFCFGFLLGLLLVLLWASISLTAGTLTLARAPQIDWQTTAITLGTYLCLACREELAFHGYPLRRLQRGFGVWGAQIFVGARVRRGTPTRGLELAAGYPRCGSWIADVRHGGDCHARTRGADRHTRRLELWAMALGLKGEPGIWKAILDENKMGEANLTKTIAYILVMTLATLGFWLWYRRAIRLATEAADLP